MGLDLGRLLAALGVTAALASCATDPGGAGAAAPPSHGAAKGTASGHSPDRMDSMMRSMRELHARMSAAKSPEERADLMRERVRLMHRCMVMMGDMHRGGGAVGLGRPGMSMSPEAVKQHMEMLELMMQVLKDHQSMKDPVPPSP